VRYGTVALTGSLPHGAELDTLAAAIAAVPGVQRVVASIDGS
jgi:osmotically-inducible protein OsmY